MTPASRQIVAVLEPGVVRHACLDIALEHAMGCAPSALVLLSCGVEQALPPSWTGPSLVEEYAALMRRRREERLEELAKPLRRAGVAVLTVDGCCMDLAATLRRELDRLRPDLIVKETRPDGRSPWHSVTDDVVLKQRSCEVLLVTPDGRRQFTAVPASSGPAAPAIRPASSP